MRRTFLAIALFALTAPALAVGKVTVDPNTPGSANEVQGAKADTRLARKVSVTRVRATVSAILDELTKNTGVTFKAGYNNGDWQVRDRKMIIFAKDVPLHELMDSISRVMKFKWSRSGEADATAAGVSGFERSGNPETPVAWQYRLYMDRKTLLDAEAQKARSEEKSAAELARKRANALAKYGETEGLSGAQMEKLKADNPLLYIIAQSGMGGQVASFFNQVPAAAEALASNRRLDMDGRGLSPSAWASLLKAAGAEMALEHRFGSTQWDPTELDNLDPSKVSIIINQNMETNQRSPGMAFLLGELTLSYDGRNISAPIIDPESEAAKTIGAVALQSEQENRDINEVLKEHIGEFTAAMTKEAAVEVGGEAVGDHPDDPALEAKVTLKPESVMLAHMEKTLAEESKFAVVSDSFGAVDMPVTAHFSPSGSPIGQTEKTIRQALDDIEEAYIYNWDKHGSVIELRDRNWFKKRANEIPEAWLDGWRNELIKTGTLEIDTLSEIAQLTQEQMAANVVSDELLRTCSSTVQINRELLRVWAGLSSDQRAAMLSESGLDLSTLSEEQWAQTSSLLRARFGGQTVDSGKPLAIVCARFVSEKRCSYTFTLLDGAEPKKAITTFVTPVYTPPAPRPQPAKPAVEAKPEQAPKEN